MLGMGSVYEAFRSGRIVGSDDIAVLYDPVELRPLTVPLVSIRYRLERLVALGEMSTATAREALIAAHALPLAGRAPETIDRDLISIVGSGWLVSASFPDIKARDARRLVRSLDAGA
jgi:hypothetical protein